MKAIKEVNSVVVEVEFDYSESCRNVYKTFKVYINNKKSNVKGLLKYVSNEVPNILTANTYFWNSCSNAASRRSNEQRKMNEVEQFFLSENFIIG